MLKYFRLFFSIFDRKNSNILANKYVGKNSQLKIHSANIFRFRTKNSADASPQRKVQKKNESQLKSEMSFGK